MTISKELQELNEQIISNIDSLLQCEVKERLNWSQERITHYKNIFIELQKARDQNRLLIDKINLLYGARTTYNEYVMHYLVDETDKSLRDNFRNVVIKVRHLEIKAIVLTTHLLDKMNEMKQKLFVISITMQKIQQAVFDYLSHPAYQNVIGKVGIWIKNYREQQQNILIENRLVDLRNNIKNSCLRISSNSEAVKIAYEQELKEAVPRLRKEAKEIILETEGKLVEPYLQPEGMFFYCLDDNIYLFRPYRWFAKLLADIFGIVESHETFFTLLAKHAGQHVAQMARNFFHSKFSQLKLEDGDKQISIQDFLDLSVAAFSKTKDKKYHLWCADSQTEGSGRSRSIEGIIAEDSILDIGIIADLIIKPQQPRTATKESEQALLSQFFDLHVSNNEELCHEILIANKCLDVNMTSSAFPISLHKTFSADEIPNYIFKTVTDLSEAKTGEDNTIYLQLSNNSIQYKIMCDGKKIEGSVTQEDVDSPYFGTLYELIKNLQDSTPGNLLMYFIIARQQVVNPLKELSNYVNLLHKIESNVDILTRYYDSASFLQAKTTALDREVLDQFLSEVNQIRKLFDLDYLHTQLDAFADSIVQMEIKKRNTQNTVPPINTANKVSNFASFGLAALLSPGRGLESGQPQRTRTSLVASASQ